MNPRFRKALAKHLGSTLTPEICAEIELEAFRRDPLPEPTEQVLSGGMRVSALQHQAYLDVLNERLGTAHHLDKVRLLTVLRGADVAAVVMYSRFSPLSCEMTIATDGHRDWASRATLRAIFGYPFADLNLRRVTVVIHERNDTSIELCARLGYRFEGKVREAFADGADGVLMGMLRRECRWIGGSK